MDKFVHLHNHSDNSLLDGAQTVKRLVSTAKRLGQPAVGLTDHGYLNGAHDLYTECQKQQIKPIIGLEAYVSPALKEEKSKIYFGGEKGEGRKNVGGDGSYTHLSLFARNSEGLRNLYRLHRLSFRDGFYSKPRIDLPTLFRHKTGLIVLSGCLGSELQTYIKLGMEEEAKDYVAKMKDEFGPDFYIEIMDHGVPDEAPVNPQLVELSHRFKIEMVATNDCHYAEVADRATHDAFLRIQTGPNGLVFDGDGYYLKSRREMEALPLPAEALDNTLAVADRIEGYDEVFEKKTRLANHYIPDDWDQEKARMEVDEWKRSGELSASGTK